MPKAIDPVEQFFATMKTNCNSEYIKSIATVPGVPMEWGTKPEDQIGASSRLLRHLEAVYLPGDVEIDFIKDRMGSAYEFGRILYRNQRNLMELLYDPRAARKRWPKCTDNQLPVLLTGRAGVGKSSLLQAMARAMNHGHETFYANPEHSEFTVRPVAFATGEEGHSVKGLYSELAELSDDHEKQSGTHFNRLVRASLMKRLTCMFFFDEAQFSDSATSTNIRNMLVALKKLRFPWVYAANYSLVKKLLEQEEQYLQRFTGRVLDLLPPQRGSVAWKKLLAEYDKVFGNQLEEKLVKSDVELWDLSCGIPRVLVNILRHSFDISLQRENSKITVDDIRLASQVTGVINQVRSVRKQLGNGFPNNDTDSPFKTEEEKQYLIDRKASQQRLAAQSYAESQAQERVDSAGGLPKGRAAAVTKTVKPKLPAIPSKSVRDSLSDDEYGAQFASP